jgi:hypothetical protein
MAKYDDEDDDDDLPIKKKELSGMDAFFGNTSTIVLVFFGLCCGLIALILSIIGLSTCTDEKAKANAKLVLIVCLVGQVIYCVLGMINGMMNPGGFK